MATGFVMEAPMHRNSVNDIVLFVPSLMGPNHSDELLKVLPILNVFIFNRENIFLRP